MRVLLNTRPLALFKKTGIGYYVFNLHRELLKSDIEIVTTLDTKSRTLVNSLSRISTQLRRLLGERYNPVAKFFGDALIGRLSKKGTAESFFDIYHETSLDPMPEINARRTICNVYDISFLRYPEYLTEDFAGYAAANVRRSVTAADRIIVNTQFIKDEVMTLYGIQPEKIDIVPLAPGGNYYQNRHAPRPAKIRRFTEKNYVLYVGTVEPRKNLRTLIKAFREVRSKHDLSLIIAGKLGWLYDDIISYPGELGIRDDVIFTEYVSERTVLQLYNNALIFVYPSSYEGFGLPPLEAMACGVPVIISDIPPLMEVAGDAALTFKKDDAEDLAKVMEQLITSGSLRADLVRKGAKKAEGYSWKKVAASTVKTYEKALEG